MHHSSTHIYKNCAAPLFLNKCIYIMYTHTYILQEVFCTTHAIYEPNSIASFLGISGFHSCYHLLFIKKIVLYAVQFILLYCFYEWDRLRILWTSKYTWDLSENWYRRKTYNSWVLNGWVVFHIVVRGSMKSKSCLESSLWIWFHCSCSFLFDSTDPCSFFSNL